MEEQNKDICSIYPDGCPECRRTRGRCILGDPQRDVYAKSIAQNLEAQGNPKSTKSK